MKLFKNKFKQSLFNVLIFFSVYLGNLHLYAASCCGAAFSVPSIITTDDKAQLATSYTYSKAHADVLANGDWRERTEDDYSQIFKLEGAHIISDRWQVGLSSSYHQRTKNTHTTHHTQGWGDTTAQMGYEYLTNWNYHPYRPKGIGYFSLISPTGRSLNDSNSTNSFDARGRGFWGVGLGSILTKNFKRWDANLNFEIHHSFEKKVNQDHEKKTLRPGQGGSLSLGSGYHFKSLRLGGLVAWAYEDPIIVRGHENTEGNLQRYTHATIILSYLIQDNSTLSLNYTDQTLLASPSNTTLSKSLSLFFQKRWQR